MTRGDARSQAARELGKWLLWLAVIPGTLVASIIAYVPVHFVLFFMLSPFVEPYPRLPERLLASLVSSGAFVWVGAAIAPEYKSRVAIVLFAEQMLLLVIVAVKLLGWTWVHSWIFWAGLSLDAAGAAIAYYIVRRKWGNFGTRRVAEDNP
ncbi:MAG TPA: hypothetical protein VGR66_04675 [Candidatus Eisenbacteria bacterium]|nr:hypothetical protein [Candidatus Eisenbacteria bacterium]